MKKMLKKMMETLIIMLTDPSVQKEVDHYNKKLEEVRVHLTESKR